MDPQQELYTALLVAFRSRGYEVYDVLPPEGTPYPFIYLGNARQSDSQTKTSVHGTVYQTIHVWHNDPRRRGELSSIMLDIKRICRELEHTANFDWHVQNLTQEILSDTSTKHPLLHGVIDADFKFN